MAQIKYPAINLSVPGILQKVAVKIIFEGYCFDDAASIQGRFRFEFDGVVEMVYKIFVNITEGEIDFELDDGSVMSKKLY